jgi:hypothetical protein
MTTTTVPLSTQAKRQLVDALRKPYECSGELHSNAEGLYVISDFRCFPGKSGYSERSGVAKLAFHTHPIPCNVRSERCGLSTPSATDLATIAKQPVGTSHVVFGHEGRAFVVSPTQACSSAHLDDLNKRIGPLEEDVYRSRSVAQFHQNYCDTVNRHGCLRVEQVRW